MYDLNDEILTTLEGITLRDTPQLGRLQDALHNLIIAAYEHSSNHPGKLLSLVRCQFAYEESSEDRFCMHYDVLARALGTPDIIPLRVSFAVSKEPKTC